MIVTPFQGKYLAVKLIRFALIVRQLVTSLLHIDALTIVTTELCAVAPSQFHLMGIFFAFGTFVPVA